MPSRVLLDRIAEAYSLGDRVALFALYHDDALICSAAEPNLVLLAAETAERSELQHRTQLIGPISVIPIDEISGMLHAIARVANADGQFQPAAERFWLLTFKDGLVYRQRVLETREEATTLYAQHGVELGLNTPASAQPTIPDRDADR